MDGTTRLFLLGAVRAVHGGDEHLLAGAQPRLVLVHAALRRGGALPADELAELLWPSGPARHWEGALRGVVAKVRAFLATMGSGVATLDNLGRSYRFEAIDPDLVDIWRAERRLGSAEVALEHHDRARAAAAAVEAADLLGADLLAGIDEPWLTPWRTRFEVERRRALRVAAVADGALGHHGAAVEHARRAVDLDPIDEESHRVLMAALVDSGNRGGALASYASCRRALADELGIAPSVATEDLYLSILAEPSAGARSLDAPAEERRTWLPARADRPFVGRRVELDALERAWGAARAGRRRAVLLHGDAGVGKTCLALEAVRAWKPVNVLYGGSSPEQVIPFEPFAEALERHLALVDDDALEALLGSFGPEIVALVPMVADRVVASERAGPASGAESRSRIFEAVRALVERVATVPTVLVLDDLQWADPSSLLLARHLVRKLDHTRLLVLATYRDDEDTNAELQDTIAALRRVEGCDALRVEGLTVEDVIDLVRAGDGAAPDELGEILHRRTGGNGFYVSQVLAATAEHPGSIDATEVPDSVVDVVRIRIAGLSAPAREVLGVAAVLGATSSSALLEATVAMTSDDAFDRAIEELVDRHLLLESAGGNLSFAHAIVRDAVHGQLTRGRRRRVHLRAALAAERMHRVDLDWAASVARHYVAADDPGHAKATVDATIRAARQAEGVLAYEQAAELYQHAARTLDRFGLDDDRRAAIQLGLGAASRRCGDFATAREALGRALDLARSASCRELFAEIVLELVAKGGRGVAVAMPDADRADLLQEAVDGLPDDDPAREVSLLAELALALLLTDQTERRVAAAERAEAIAERSGDADLVARAAVAHRLRHPGPEHAGLRRCHTDHLVGGAGPGVTGEQLVRLHMWRLTDSLELGDRPGVDRELAALVESARALGQPYWTWIAATWEALHTFLGGDGPRAEVQAASALDAVADLAHPETVVAYGVQHIGFRLLEGRGAEVLDLLSGVVADRPDVAAMRCGLAFALAQTGAADEARSHLAALASGRFAAIPLDSNWSVSMACLAETASVLGDRALAATMIPILEPLRDRFVVVTGFGAGGACWGPFSGVLGSLWCCVGEPGRARAEYDHALAAIGCFDSPPLRERVLRARDGIRA